MGICRENTPTFCFGSSLIKWVNLFYRDIQSCVVNNGWSAGFFELTRGVRQGCPLSPYIVCAEVLAITIRKDNSVKGIQWAALNASSVNMQMTLL